MLRRFPVWIAVILACRQPVPATADAVAPWIRLVTTSASREGVDAPVASRMHAYGAITLYEAYAADSRSGLRTLAGQLNGLWHVPTRPSSALDAATIAAEAARLVLDSMFTGASASTKSLIDSLSRQQIAARRAAGVDGRTSDRSRDHGASLAREILAWAASDGFFTTRNRLWRPTARIGTWTPPRSTGTGILQSGAPATDKNTAAGRTHGVPRVSEPHWGRLRNFTLRYGDECEPARSPDVSIMARELRDSLATITPEKRAIVESWHDSIDASPLTHWITIVESALTQTPTASVAAEMYALSAATVADGYIAAWKEKYRALVARPPAADAFLSPEYPSESAVVAAATAAILARVLGDSTPFMHSSRAFRNFSHARDESAIAGVYAGTQFVPSVTSGLVQGQCVAARVLGRLKTR
jgi:hypothetical protein